MPLFVNTWLEPVPAQFGRQQGFILDEDGSGRVRQHGDARVRELAGCRPKAHPEGQEHRQRRDLPVRGGLERRDGLEEEARPSAGRRLQDAEMRPPVFPWASEDFAVVFGKLERERLEVFAGMSCGKLGLPLPGPGVVGHGKDFVRVVVGVLRIAGEMELLSGARHCGVEPAEVVGRGSRSRPCAVDEDVRPFAALGLVAGDGVAVADVKRVDERRP